MFKEFKSLFTTKKGVLVTLAIITVAICAYLNIITIKSLMIGNFGISYGTLLISFLPMITSEIMSEVYGWKKGFVISSLAYTVCLVFVLILWGSTKLPGEVFEGFGTEAYNMIFESSPIILIASAIAYYLGIFFNCFIMGKMKKKAQESGKDNGGKLFSRFALSTMVGQTLDNGVFFLIPFFFGTWGWTYVWQQTLAAFVIEIAYEIIFFALTRYLTKKIKELPEDEYSQGDELVNDSNNL